MLSSSYSQVNEKSYQVTEGGLKAETNLGSSADAKKYYESLRECIANEDNYPIVNNECIIGDIINVSLKENYEKYDLYWPVVIYLDDEETKIYNVDYKKIEPFREFSLEYLLKKVDKQEIFTTEEIIKKGNMSLNKKELKKSQTPLEYPYHGY